MERRYKKIFEGTIADYMRSLKENKPVTSKHPEKIKPEHSFGKAFAEAKRLGQTSFIWKNPITKKTRTYNTENNKKDGKKVSNPSRKTSGKIQKQ